MFCCECRFFLFAFLLSFVLPSYLLAAEVDVPLAVDGLVRETEQKLGETKLEEIRRSKQDVHEYLPDYLKNPQTLPETSDEEVASKVLIRSVSIKGASVFEREDFSECLDLVIGHRVSEHELVALSVCMTKHYLDAGYSLSRVVLPAQDIDRGHLRVKVIEGYISHYKVEGGDGTRFGVDRLVAPILAQRPVTQKMLERQLLLINDIIGLTIEDTSLSEVGELTGAYELVLSVKTFDLLSRGDLDNRGSEGVGPYQSYQSLYFNSLFGFGESLGVSYSSIPAEFDELAFLKLSLDLPLDERGTKLLAYMSASETKPSDFQKEFDTRYRSLLVSAQLQWVLQRDREFSSWAGVGVWNSSNQWENRFGRFVNDELRGVSAFLNFQAIDRFGGQNYVRSSLLQGLELGGSTRDGDSDRSRFDGEGIFTKLYIDYVRVQALNENWSFKIDGAIQLASEGLLASQEFYLGGFRFGRGFESGSIAGDSGAGASLEVRYSKEIDDIKWMNSIQLYGFLDAGGIIDDGNEIINGHFMSSAGGGIRLFLEHGIDAQFEIGAPLDYGVLKQSHDSEFTFRIGRSVELEELSLKGLMKLSPIGFLQN